MTAVPRSGTRPRAPWWEWAAVLIPPLIVLALGWLAYVSIQRAGETSDVLERGYEARAEMDRLLAYMVDAETATRGFMLTGDTRYLQPYRGVPDGIDSTLAALNRKVVDAGQRQRLNALEPLIEARIENIMMTLRLRVDLPAEDVAVRERLARGREMMDEIRLRIASMQRAQDRILADREATDREWGRMVALALLVGTVVTVLLALIANATLVRHANRSAAAAAELEVKNEELEDQAAELEHQAGEMEQQALELEERTAEVQQSEERFRSLIENAPHLIVVLDGSGRTVRYESPAVQRTLGYPPGDDVGANVRKLVHPEDRASVKRAFLRVLRDRALTETIEMRIRHIDGHWRIVESTIRNLIGDPAIGGLVVNSRDITARRETQDALRQSQEQLQQARKMEAIGRLAGGVAHDFNNLLTAIKANVELLLLDVKEKSSPAELKEIAFAADRATSLTRQLLAFSRRQVLQPMVLDLNALVVEMDQLVRRLIGEDIEVTTVLSPELGRVKADAGQLEQVLMNLVVNARDAMRRGGTLIIETANVTVDMEYADQYAGKVAPGPHVMLAVSDTGTGMDDATKERLFEPFFTTKPEGEGTGLGLSTVYGIVEQSGGCVSVYSDPGRGTTFKVLLPRILDGADRTVPTERAAPPQTRSETVLLVEDDHAVREVTRKVLERSGFTVLQAAGPDEGISVAEAYGGTVHLLLTDVVMPGMNGREMSDLLLASRPRMHVLFMSGYTDEAISHHGVLDDDARFIQKPFAPADLVERIVDLLDDGAGRTPSPRRRRTV
jgi:PAS domain S-box-containing protein